VAVERERENESDAGAADAWALLSRVAAAAAANARSGPGGAITAAVERVGTALGGGRALPGRVSPEFARLLAGVRRPSGRAFEDPAKRAAATQRRKCAPQPTAALCWGGPDGRSFGTAGAARVPPGPLPPRMWPLHPPIRVSSTSDRLNRRPFGASPSNSRATASTTFTLLQFHCPREVSDSRFTV
jgi:hypothetical protein